MKDERDNHPQKTLDLEFYQQICLECCNKSTSFLTNFIFIHQKYSKGLYNFFVLVFKGQIW